MNWSRNKSNIEDLMVAVLKKKKLPMSIGEIADAIMEVDSSLLSGKTPRNSLYSIVYRREKRRVENGEKTLFKITEERRVILYSLNK